MNPAEKAVRDAATALRVAIETAEALGFRVDLPRRAKDLDSIAISATAKFRDTIIPPVERPKPSRRTKKS
jgi:hypothetical protein